MQAPASPFGRKHWQVACAGAAANVSALICDLCSDDSIFHFCGQTASATQLVREVSPPPDIVLMDDALVTRRGLAELAHLHRALPGARTLLIADSVQPSTMFAALRLGTWGVLPRMRVEADLNRALSAVANGELWLTRRQLAIVMVFVTSSEQQDFMELTARENAVMRRVLVGLSNKQIARMLNIAEHTVKIHLHHAYGKLHVHSRVELLLRYRRDSNPLLQAVYGPPKYLV